MDRWSKTAGVGVKIEALPTLKPHVLIASYFQQACKSDCNPIIWKQFNLQYLRSPLLLLKATWESPKKLLWKEKKNTNKTRNGGSVATAMQQRNREEKQIQKHCLAGRHHNQEQVWMIINRTAHILSLSPPGSLHSWSLHLQHTNRKYRWQMNLDPKVLSIYCIFSI